MSKMWKCIFVRLEFYIQGCFDNETLAWRRVLCPCPPEGFQPLGPLSNIFLAGLLSKSFSHKASLQVPNHQFLPVLLCCRMQSLSYQDWFKLFYTVQNLHCDNDSWIYPASGPFSGTFPANKPARAFNNLMQTFIFFVRVAVDFSWYFLFRLVFISFRPFIIHLKITSRTFCLFDAPRVRLAGLQTLFRSTEHLMNSPLIFVYTLYFIYIYSYYIITTKLQQTYDF